MSGGGEKLPAENYLKSKNRKTLLLLLMRMTLSLCFPKWRLPKKKKEFFVKKFTLQTGLKNQNFYQIIPSIFARQIYLKKLYENLI